MSGKVGYWLGVTLGLLLIYGLYAIGAYGVVVSLINREIPYLPLVFIVVVFCARKLIQIQFYLQIRASVEDSRARVAQLDEEVQRMMVKVARQGRQN